MCGMQSGKKHWLTKDLLGFGLASFFNDFSHEMAISILPLFVEQLIGSAGAPLALGIINGISNAVSSFTKVYSGFISDRLANIKPLLVIGYAVTPLFIGLLGTAHHMWHVVIYKTCAWIGKGLREPPRDAWLTEITDKKDFGKAFGFQRALDTLGAIAGPLVAFFALSYVSLKTIFFISLIPGLFSVLSIMVIVGKYVKPPSSPSFEPTDIFSQLYALPQSFNYFVVIRFLFGIGNFNVMLLILRSQDFFSAHAQMSSIVATSTAIALYVVFNIIRLFGEFGSGVVSDYVNRNYLLALLGFGLFGCVCLGLIIHAHSIIGWALIFIMAGLSTATVTVVEKVYAADLLPDYLRGTGYGILHAVKGIGELFAGLFIGGLWTYISATTAFSCAAAISFIAMFLLLIVKNPHTKIPLMNPLHNISP
jgi:MFS family permease